MSYRAPRDLRPFWETNPYHEDDAAGMIGGRRDPRRVEEERHEWEELEEELTDGKLWRRRRWFDDEKGDR